MGHKIITFLPQPQLSPRLTIIFICNHNSVSGNHAVMLRQQKRV